MNQHLRVLTLLLLIPFGAFAQNGRLSGTITDAKTKQPIPFSTVRVFSGGQLKGGGAADENGHYVVAPLSPGSYDAEYSSTGYTARRIKGVTVSFEQNQRQDVGLAESLNEREEIVVTDYKVKLIDRDNTSTGARLTSKDIEKLPTRNINQVIATQAAVYSADDGGDLNIRGNRGGDNIVYINGVRQFGNAYPPVETISEISVITGGIPAQYGDALGGIISVTTKGAADKYRGGVQLETSRLFDKYQYDLYGLNFSGPLWRKTTTDPVTNKTESRTLLGIYSAIQFNREREDAPSPYGFRVANKQTQDSLEQYPLRRLPNGTYRSSADFFNAGNFNTQSYRPNSAGYTINTNATLDFAPADNILISVGGNLEYGRKNNFALPQGGFGGGRNALVFNPFNYNYNNLGINYDGQAFIRFRQTFPNLGGSEKALLKNFYYQIQADYYRTYGYTQDRDLKDKYELYNYTGKYVNKDVYTLGNTLSDYFFVYSPNSNTKVDSFPLFRETPNGNRPLPIYLQGGTITQGAAGGFDYIPFGGNSLLTNLNKQILSTEASLGAPVQSLEQLQNKGGALNGQGSQYNAGYFFNTPGTNQSNLGVQSKEQYRFSAQVGGDLGSHALKLGFDYEQRVITSWGAAQTPWISARRLLNTHIIPNQFRGTSLSSFNEIVNADGSHSIYINPDLPINTDGEGRVVGQTDFDRRVRAALGYPINKLINLDELDPSLLHLTNFTPQEIFADGSATNLMSGWQGYDPYGNRIRKRVSFNDFFTDTVNRPIDAFRPIYTAAYIEDKFEINDLILRLGFRVDRFDINQPVLRDRYSLTRLTHAGEVDLSQFRSAEGGQFVRPSTIGDDYAVYLNQTADRYTPGPSGNAGSFAITGFRNGSTWYNAQGQEVADYRQVASGGNFYPLYNIRNLGAFDRGLQAANGITLDAFTDFKPQVNLMPRMAFSFPISEDALFFAHYDILTQRPTSVIANGRSGPITFDNFGNPLQYYQISRVQNGFLSNPNLKPQKKIDYQIGFQQRITQNTALKLSAFYSEIRDLIQIVNVLGGYPNPGYRTNGNIDFGVVKGMTLQYDYRKINGVGFGMNANYTLQFAEGSSSDFAQSLLNTASPNLRNIAPQNWDQRHAFKLNADYRFGKYNQNPGPEIFGFRPFENSGINYTFTTGSGLPFTRDGSVFGQRTIIQGSINGSRLPWNNRSALRVDKTFFFKPYKGMGESSINVYVYAQNLFNQVNTLGVYARTTSPTDDGFLSSVYGKQQLASGIYSSPESYAYYYNYQLLNPSNVSLPRRVRLGVTYNF